MSKSGSYIGGHTVITPRTPRKSKRVKKRNKYPIPSTKKTIKSITTVLLHYKEFNKANNKEVEFKKKFPGHLKKDLNTLSPNWKYRNNESISILLIENEIKNSKLHVDIITKRLDKRALIILKELLENKKLNIKITTKFEDKITKLIDEINFKKKSSNKQTNTSNTKRKISNNGKINIPKLNRVTQQIYRIEEKIKLEKGRPKNTLVIKLEGLKKEKNKKLRTSSRKNTSN